MVPQRSGYDSREGAYSWNRTEEWRRRGETDGNGEGEGSVITNGGE